MRLYFYISEAGELNHLSKILTNAKHNNLRDGVSGLMSYNKGRYLQIIEGDKKRISQLIKYISTDTRHHDVNSILDIETSHRYFGDWAMKLIPQMTNNESFEVFMRIMASKIERIPASKRALLRHFYDCPELADKPVIESQWELKRFSIPRWPNFSEIEPTPELMALCGVLLTRTMSYEELSAHGYYDSDAKLKQTLVQLNEVNCLIVSSTPNLQRTTQQNGFDDDNDSGGMAFINKMRNFISARLH